ncbi:MAG: 5'/3'-nucleotidase SurE [Gammaproteobacteria bacterium]|nr:5'/3'-nucleotidase SurE [Gammaproteobacteria bacterium]
MLKILISNDDGVYADGIQILNSNLSEVFETTIVAPDRNRSGASNSLSLDRPLKVQQIKPNMSSVNGTPTDCVHLAVTGWLRELPDMVISGINCGANLGDDVLYSGTVAAAMEGRFLGYPAMAVSLANHMNTADANVNVNLEYYNTAAKVVRELVLLIKEHGLPKDVILNVNVPAVPYRELKGFAVTRCGSRHPAEPTIFAKDPRGQDIFWIGPAGKESDAGVGTDFAAIREKKVSITPLKVDMTAHDKIDILTKWVGTHLNEKFFE